MENVALSRSVGIGLIPGTARLNIDATSVLDEIFGRLPALPDLRAESPDAAKPEIVERRRLLAAEDGPRPSPGSPDALRDTELVLGPLSVADIDRPPPGACGPAMTSSPAASA